MRASLLWLICFGIRIAGVPAADFNVVSEGGIEYSAFYTINGMTRNPTLTLVRGETYTFFVAAGPTHPFAINAPSGTVSNNNINLGTITFRVPTNEANYVYFCTTHGFGAQTLTVAPPPPIRIVRLDLGPSFILRSTGTNTWSLIPQFSTNLASTNWFALTCSEQPFRERYQRDLLRPPARQPRLHTYPSRA